MNNQTSTLSDPDLDRVTGGVHRDPGMKWEEKKADPSLLDKIIGWLTGKSPEVVYQTRV